VHAECGMGSRPPSPVFPAGKARATKREM